MHDRVPQHMRVSRKFRRALEELSCDMSLPAKERKEAAALLVKVMLSVEPVPAKKSNDGNLNELMERLNEKNNHS